MTEFTSCKYFFLCQMLIYALLCLCCKNRPACFHAECHTMQPNLGSVFLCLFFPIASFGLLVHVCYCSVRLQCHAK